MDKFISFIVPSRTVVQSPLSEHSACYHELGHDVAYWQCTVCHLVWRDNVPDGHVCEPPIDPKFAWVA